MMLACVAMNCVPFQMVLMPGCSHAVCKVCFESNFTNVMKTQTVKHFNCPVCSLPDMSNRDADQDMYQELLVTMVGYLCIDVDIIMYWYNDCMMLMHR